MLFQLIVTLIMLFLYVGAIEEAHGEEGCIAIALGIPVGIVLVLLWL